MDILQLALDTRKLILVDISLSLIQKLIAHQHLVGPVTAASHKREQGAAPRRKGEDEEEVDAAAGDALSPQVSRVWPACRTHTYGPCMWHHCGSSQLITTGHVSSNAELTSCLAKSCSRRRVLLPC